MTQNWIINKATGQYELLEDYESERAKTKQKALLEYNVERIKQDKVSE